MDPTLQITPSGKPKLGYSYPSGQRRQGPAPLASFEDLPSDEQVSPEGDGDDNTLQDLSPGPEEFDHILSFDSRDVLCQPSPLKIVGPRGSTTNHENNQNTINGVSVTHATITNDSLLSPVSGQEWSSQTVTPITFHQISGEEASPASGEVTPTGYSSPMVPCGYDNITSRSYGGNLTVPSGDESGGEKSPSPDSRRKGSWTDIFFRGRSRSRSKSPIGSECSAKSPSCEETVATEKVKNKKGFFSFLKVGRKGSTSSGTTNGSTPAQSSSSTVQPYTSTLVSTPSQENEPVSLNERNGKNIASSYNTSNYTNIISDSNVVNKENGTNVSATTISSKNTFDHTSSRPMNSFGENGERVKLREELTIPQDLNEPKESQQDIINIIQKEIEQKIFDFNEDIKLDLPPNLQFEELLSSNQATSVKTASKNQESGTESSSDIVDPTTNNISLPKPNLSRKLITRTDTIDDECQSLPRSFKTKDLNSSINKTTETVVATIEHNSSEKGYSSGSDLEESSATLNAETSKKASYLKRQSSETSENDFEAATLLTHDSIDYDDYDGPTELIFTPDAEDKMTRENSSRASARRRLDVNTIPIDRPRSTTPINIAPLEAFLNTASPSPDPNVEKIRLSLPGDTFSNFTRAKSPRKINPAIWLEFCEKGLHSPKSYHRRRRSTLEKDVCLREPTSFGSLGIKNINQTSDAFTPVTETPSQAVSPLTPITPLDFEDQWTPFGDNFNPYAFIKDNLEHQVERYKWSMECDKCDCLIGKLGNINSNDPSGCNTPAEDPLSPRELNELGDEQPLVSPIACSCDCHHNISIVRSNSNQMKQQEGLFSISSDISSASSRLVQASSASSSKSSSVGEVEDKVLS